MFVGGSTRIPLVWEMVADHTGIEPLAAVNPDEAVALGAGIQAAIIAGEPLDAILVDVTPHSLGIEVAMRFFDQVVPDQYAPIIHRNTTIPSSHARQFRTLYPDQDRVQLKVYQGENPVASQNTLLGEFMFEGLAAEHPGEMPSVTVRFDLDLNGMLEVTAMDRGSGNKQGITVKAEHRRMNAAEKAAAAAHVADITSAQHPAPEELAALLSRATQVLQDKDRDLDALRDLVAQIDQAITDEVDETELQDLSDKLLDTLYDLDEG